MEKTKLINAIGLANKGRKIIKGVKLFESITKNKIKIVIIGTDMGTSQKKKLIDKCSFYKIPYFCDQLTCDELSRALSSKKTVAIGIWDGNICKLLNQNL